MSQLALSLLGSFQACLDEQPISGFRSQKARGLLAYLAVEAGRPHTRAALAAFLWPDAQGGTAFNYLRSALANLRDLLGDRASAAAGRAQFLLITRETLQLNPAADIWLDVAAFAALGRERPGQQALEGALALYRGPFLDGFRGDDSPAFAEWLLITREHFNRVALAVLQQLAALAIEQHRYAAAEEYCRRWLALEPWDEAGHRQLMATLALAGNRSAALAYYQSCRSLLAQELGVEPAPETTALYVHILSGQTASGARSAVGAAGVQLLAVQTQENLSPFVAREAELAQLDRLLTLTLQGAGRVAFVEGDAGSGKTSLLHTFARRAAQHQAGIAIAEGHCSDCAGCGDSYLPFREIIRLLASNQGAATQAGSAIEPWLRRRFGAAEQTAAPAVGSTAPVQSDLFEQVTQFLQEMAQQQPLLLLLDDLQWADRGTISLLFHLSRQLSGSRILLVGAYRPEDVAQGEDRQRSPLVLVVHEVQRSSGDLPINLNRVDGRAFIDALLDGELNRLGEVFRATLYRHTEGQALFTVELLRAMKERGDLVQDAGGAWIERAAPDWQSLPPRVEAVVAERIERLPRRLRSLLEAASVEGEIFCLETLALQSHLPLTQLAWWFGELLCRQHGLVREAGAVVDGNATRGVQLLARYRFAHSLYQAYLYERLDGVRRASLHRGIAAASERLHAESLDAVAVPLAWHFEQGGDLAKAAHYCRLAGDGAMRSSTCEAAIGHYLHALALLAALPHSPERTSQEAALHLALAEPLTMLRGWGAPEARDSVQYAYQMGRNSADLSRLVQVMSALSTMAIGRGELAEALATADALMLMAQQDGERATLAAAHFALGEAHYFRCELAAACLHLEQAVALYAEGEPAPQIVTGVDMAVAAETWLGWSLWAMGRVEQAAARCAHAVARAWRLDEPGTLAFALLLPGAMIDLQCGKLPSAADSAATAGRLCDEHNIALYRSAADVVLGYLAVLRGASAAGLAQMEQGLTAWQAQGALGGVVFFRLLLAAALGAAGCVEAGLATVAGAQALVASTGLAYGEAEIWRLRGELLAAAEPGTAEACFYQAIAIARDRQTRLWELRATLSLSRLWQAQGRGAEAVPLLAAIYGSFMEGRQMPDLQAAAAQLRALATHLPPLLAADDGQVAAESARLEGDGDYLNL